MTKFSEFSSKKLLPFSLKLYVKRSTNFSMNVKSQKMKPSRNSFDISMNVSLSSPSSFAFSNIEFKKPTKLELTHFDKKSCAIVGMTMYDM